MTDELDAFIKQCGKMFTKTLIRIICSDDPKEHKIKYFEQLLIKIDEIDNLIVNKRCEK